MTQNDTILARLMAVIEDRKAQLPEHSYTTKLFRGGVARSALRFARRPRK